MSRFREVVPERLSEFLRKGFKARHFFPHRLYYLPRAGSDGMQLARSIYGVSDARRLRQVLLFATGPALEGIPSELFFDDDLVWHQQQLGLPGHVAAANLIVHGRALLTTARFSDIVQRIGRRRAYLTRVEKRFHGWDHMLLNGILNFAVEHGLTTIRFPTAEVAMANTDPARHVEPALFERIYDHDILARFEAERRGRLWIVDVSRNQDRGVPPNVAYERLPDQRTICVCHDIERELGHVDVAPAFATVAATVSRANLFRMLEIEARRGVRGTYNVVGCFLNEVRQDIEQRQHEVSFHSYDHTRHLNQVGACRGIDYRIKGYRPPKSELTPELTDDHLAFHNFEWLASSPRSIGAPYPAMRAGIVRIPIEFDDFPMYKMGMSFDAWERDALQTVRERQVIAFGLHDCYAQYWLDRFDEFLAKLERLGRFATLGEVASRVALGCAE
ncbi:MAG TPA: hypothetical protein VMS64_40295 [Candidatus Methylomirabilis sp.]|nr:hypothetical protein [Candidatus Methylomirabilis sp.]